jgi:hypothetical protein
MGKNFEWTQRAEISLGALPRPATVGNESVVKNKSLLSTEAIKSVAPAVREESLKLVQRLFLTPGQASPKAVMFVAIDSGSACSRLCGVVAEILAESVSGSVCLVDGNFRAPLLADSFGLAELRGEFDYVLVDVPPLNVFEDALAFGQLVDGAVLVVEANATRREAAMQAADRLRKAGIPVLGAVLNNRTFAIPKALYERV